MRFSSTLHSLCLLALFMTPLCTMTACNGFFYQPSRRIHDWPERDFDEITFRARDGVELHGWFFPAQGALKGTFVQFHGNAGNVSSHFKGLDWVVEHGYQFLTFDYRGYGRSGGYPYPGGVQLDALAAIAYAQRLPLADRSPDLILYGQSLGGAVLLDAYGALKNRARVRALVVEGTFHSYQEVAASALWRRPLLFPLTGFAYATLSDDHAPAPAIPRVSPTPLLVIHGENDPVVPAVFGQVIYNLAQAPRELWIVLGGRHIDAMRRPEYREKLLAFVEHPLRKPAVRKEPRCPPPRALPEVLRPRCLAAPEARANRTSGRAQCELATVLR